MIRQISFLLLVLVSFLVFAPYPSVATPAEALIEIAARTPVEHGGMMSKGKEPEISLAPASTMVFDIAIDYEYGQVTSGTWPLASALEIRFTSPCEPHEAAVFTLFAPTIQTIEGRFDNVVLPEGWLYDIDDDTPAKTVILRNLRPDRAPAFPGAEGFGKYTIGGRVYAVTKHDDNGPGNLREAIEAESPRIVVFRVSGTIALEKSISLKNPYITITGQTAPGDGICLKGYPLTVSAPHTILRYIRSRPGNIAGKAVDGMGRGESASFLLSIPTPRFYAVRQQYC